MTSLTQKKHREWADDYMMRVQVSHRGSSGSDKEGPECSLSAVGTSRGGCGTTSQITDRNIFQILNPVWIMAEKGVLETDDDGD